MLELPKEIVWDYPETPKDDLWRLQRLADFFPHYGRDRASVQLLCQRLPELKIPREVAELICMYAEYYDSRP